MTAKENAQVADERLQFECVARTVRALEERLEAVRAGLERIQRRRMKSQDAGEVYDAQAVDEVAELLSASPAPQHPDSALLARIAAKFQAAFPTDSASEVRDEVYFEVADWLRARAQGQGGGNG